MIVVPDPLPVTITAPEPLPSPNPLFHDLVDWHHRRHCSANHTDMCGYEYVSWNDNYDRQSMRWNSKRLWAEDVVRWLARDDAPTDTLIDSFVKRAWNAGLISPELLEDTITAWKARRE